MKTTLSSYKTAQVDDPKIVIREAGDPQTSAMLLLHGLKKVVNAVTTKGGTQICGSTQFWKNFRCAVLRAHQNMVAGLSASYFCIEGLFSRVTAGCEPCRQSGWRAYTTRI
jgi:hypothetical protein